MRSALITAPALLLLCAAFGCSLKTKPPSSPRPNTILCTEVDLLDHLPPAIAAQAPAPKYARKHEFRVNVGKRKAEVLVHWTSFRVGEDSYLLSYYMQLENAPSAAKFTPGRAGRITRALPANAAAAEGYIESMDVKWEYDEPGLPADSPRAFTLRIRSDGSHS